MTPIAISNQRPGFVPFSARPLAIAGSLARPRIVPAYKPAPYKPPMLSNPHAGKQLGAWTFSLADVPMALTFGIGGAAALVLAGVTPSPAKELATVAGLGLIAFGILNLFSGTASAEAPTPSSGAKPFPASDMNDFNLVSAKIIKPSWNEEVNRGLFSSDYDVEILWTNASDKTLTIPYRIFVDEKPQWGVGASGFTGVAYTGSVTLGPKQSAQVPLEVDLKYRSFIGALAVAINMKVQKVSPAGQVFDLDSRSFVVY